MAHTPSALAGDWITWALTLTLIGYLLGVYRAMRRMRAASRSGPRYEPGSGPPFAPGSGPGSGLGPGPGLARIASFLCGWVILATAVLGPVSQWAHVTLVGHMTQHMLLLAVAPPLLLLARPLPQYMQALPGSARRRIGPWVAKLYRATATTPISAFIVHGAVIWLWHLPLLYQLAAAHRAVHDVAHLLFFTTGLWFWWSLIAPGRLGQGGFGTATVLAVLTMMHTGMLGALMTFAPQVLYPDHPAGFGGFDSLSDQQLAGLIMWIPGGLIYTTAALALAIVWLRRTSGMVQRSSS